MKLAMYQMANAGSVKENLNKSLNAIAEAAKNHDFISGGSADRIFSTIEGQDKSAYQVALDSQIVKAFQEACKKHQIMAVPNLYLKPEEGKDNHRAYDASLLMDKDGLIVGIQKMVHVAQAELFYEQDYYLPSDDGFHVWDTPFGKIGIVVCFDRYYPESIRTEALMGADCILVPTVNTKKEPMELFEQEIGY
jgi:predicted amidohydrolase